MIKASSDRVPAVMMSKSSLRICPALASRLRTQRPTIDASHIATKETTNTREG